MAISVQVPKDLSGIKTKVALNLTKRQIICFSGAAVAGIPLYFLTKVLIGTSAASLLMMGAMLPFFFFAMYEKNGFPAEKILYFMLRQKILTPGIRPYRSENLYKQLEEKEKPTTAQKTITFEKMFRDGICQVSHHYYTKMVEFFDINYSLL